MKKSQLSPKLVSEINERKSTDLDAVLKLNSSLLDALFRLSYADLSKDEFAYLESQIRKTPFHILGYLTDMSKNVQSKTRESEDSYGSMEIIESTRISSTSIEVVLQEQKID